MLRSTFASERKADIVIIRFATGRSWREAVVHMLKERYAGDLRPLKRSIERSHWSKGTEDSVRQ
jgi:hypothetical protein